MGALGSLVPHQPLPTLNLPQAHDMEPQAHDMEPQNKTHLPKETEDPV